MELTSLKQFLDFKVFQIPDYQRGYSWGREQINELLDDLEDLSYVKEHYAGTITLQQIGNESIEVGLLKRPLFDVVDGQQRIITIQLLLSCLDQRCRKLNFWLENIEDYYLEHDVPKLRLHNDYKLFFKKVIKARTLLELEQLEYQNFTEKNLKLAKKLLIKRFSNKNLEQCKVAYSNLLNKFKINQFVVNSQNEVGLVFETMNDRGLPLSDMDKIKNYLMYLCHRFNDNGTAYETNLHFGQVFQSLVKIKSKDYFATEDQFLRNAYIVFTGDNGNLNNIHKKVKDNLITKYADDGNRDLFFNTRTQINRKRSQIKAFSEFLELASQEYVKIKTQKLEHTTLEVWLSKLNFIGYLDTFMPLLLAMSLKTSFKEHLILDIVKLLEVYAVRLFCIEQKDAKLGLSQLRVMAYEVYQGEKTYSTLKKEIKQIIKDNSDGHSLKRSIKKTPYYADSSKHRFIKYFLSEYELYLIATRTDEIILVWQNYLDEMRYSIEHIAPQVAKNREDAVSNKHSLANLVLTENNSLLGNASFADKKELYLESDLLSEQALNNISVWDNEMMKERAKYLCDFAVKRWKI